MQCCPEQRQGRCSGGPGGVVWLRGPGSCIANVTLVDNLPVPGPSKERYQPHRTRAAMSGSVGEVTTNKEPINDEVAAPVAVSQNWTQLGLSLRRTR